MNAYRELIVELGIVYFITIWYRWNERAVRIALVIAFCNLAGAFGGAIAYGVGHINGAAGLEGCTVFDKLGHLQFT